MCCPPMRQKIVYCLNVRIVFEVLATEKLFEAGEKPVVQKGKVKMVGWMLKNIPVELFFKAILVSVWPCEVEHYYAKRPLF